MEVETECIVSGEEGRHLFMIEFEVVDIDIQGKQREREVAGPTKEKVVR